MIVQRVQRSRRAGSRLVAGAVCVSRPPAFCNPFLTASAFREWLASGKIDWTATTAWAHYLKERDYQMRREYILANINTLRGKPLACWCSLDKACHADVLIELANGPTASGG